MSRAPQISRPMLPKQLAPTALQLDTIRDEDEFSAFLSSGAELAGLAVEHLRLTQGHLQNANLSSAHLLSPRLTDIKLSSCDLANADWFQTAGQRVQMTDCRLVGFAANESRWQDLRIERSLCTAVQFRFATLKRTIFADCDLRGANFQGTDLTGIQFRKCNLDGVQFSGATLKGADLRGCSIIDIKIGVNELAGAIVEHFQAAYLASLMGVVIKDEHEP
ncbi:MAG: pentapeptide repeat-containing protein [Caldilineaceae bacterium]|nr:pentapeptide repeat-containing protein [Caldilineaceae bacterium]